MTINLIMTKQGNQIDGRLKNKAYAFLEKITTDDTLPGLHIEPVENAADPRVRTGRVDNQHRAVLFKLTSDQSTTYVFHGVWNHDDAYVVACKAQLRLNPVNGIPEIRTAEAERIAAGWSSPPAEVVKAKPPAEGLAPTPLITVARPDLIDVLGLPPAVADAVLAACTDEELAGATADEPEWTQLAAMGLATGMSVADVLEELGLGTVDATTRSPDGSSTDQELLDSLAQPAAAIEFARIAGAEELRRVIEGGDFGAWRVFLHPTQRQLVDKSNKGAFRISGGAGTGKTVILVHRAARLARETPQPRIVMTTFTVNLADAMMRDLQRLDPSTPIAESLGEPGVRVAGIDAIARQIVNAAGPDISPAVAAVLGSGRTHLRVQADSLAWRHAIEVAGDDLPGPLRSPHFFQNEYHQVVLPQRVTEQAAYLRVRRPGRGVRLSRAQRATVWAVIEAYRSSARQAGTVDFQETAAIAAAHLERQADLSHGYLADHVLVDEGQDLTPAHWQLLRALVGVGPDDLFIAEDSHQRIFGSKVVLGHFGISIRGRARNLTLNYRTTEQNLRYAVAVLEGAEYTDLEDSSESTARYRSARRGPEPVLHGLPTLSDELDYAAEVVGAWVSEADPQRTGTVPLDSIAVLVRDARQRELVVTGLGDRKQAVVAVDRERPKLGKPVVMTMHRAKGTEFAKVLIFGVSEGSIPISLTDFSASDEERADALLRERSLLYVAASRARDELVVSWSGAPSPLAPTRT